MEKCVVKEEPSDHMADGSSPVYCFTKRFAFRSVPEELFNTK